MYREIEWRSQWEKLPCGESRAPALSSFGILPASWFDVRNAVYVSIWKFGMISAKILLNYPNLTLTFETDLGIWGIFTLLCMLYIGGIFASR